MLAPTLVFPQLLDYRMSDFQGTDPQPTSAVNTLELGVLMTAVKLVDSGRRPVVEDDVHSRRVHRHLNWHVHSLADFQSLCYFRYGPRV